MVQHDGGSYKGDARDVVKIYMRSGGDNQGRAEGFRWSHVGTGGDILSYEVVDAVKTKPLAKIKNGEGYLGDGREWGRVTLGEGGGERGEQGWGG